MTNLKSRLFVSLIMTFSAPTSNPSISGAPLLFASILLKIPRKLPSGLAVGFRASTDRLLRCTGRCHQFFDSPLEPIL